MDKIFAKGHVEAALVAPDGSRHAVAGGANTLLYWCADAVARLFAGEQAYRPSVIGFVCAGSDGAGNDFTFTAGDRTTKTEAELVRSGLTVVDVPIETGYKFAAEPPTAEELAEDPDAKSHYAGNKVSFHAMTVDNAESEYVYGFLLKDAAGHVLAVKKLATPVRRAAEYAMAATWTIQFN